MIPMLTKTETDHRCARTLIESDRRYFEMAAEVEELSLGQLAWMPGLTELAASCVIQRVDFDNTHEVPESWLEEIEHVLRERSVSRARVYLDNCPPAVSACFRDHGYEHRGEVGFLAPEGYSNPPQNVRFSEVRTDDDWNLKQTLHEQAMEGPDGYTNQADLWVEMERRKCATGLMHSFLVRRDEEIVATVGTIVDAGLLRLKNIVVSPLVRRCGIGVAIVHHLWKMAELDHGCRFGVFGVEGGIGSNLYRRAGLYEITRQFEWSRLMNGKR
jgi:GNAT superfamily N-acetyltransferase